MKVLVLGTSRSGIDPRTVRLVRTLAGAGHSVVFASSGMHDSRIESVASRTIRIHTRWPRSGGRIAGALRRLNPSFVRRRLVRSRMQSIAAAIAPEVIYVTTRGIADVVDGLGVPVAAIDGNSAGLNHDITRVSAADVTDSDLVPWKERPLSSPKPGRHSGKSIVLCYQRTETTPARYLSAALERAGVAVEHRYPGVDLDDLPNDALGVVFVESPYPALDVTGTTALPIVYWTHHGEHHLHQNLRLAESYKADAVLLAHSWHLGHRFSVPTFRLPFGVPLEMVDVQEPWEERPIDVAMVGAGFDGAGDRYATRRRIADQLSGRYGADRTVFVGGRTPEDVFATYGQAKVVVDEGGSLHHPVTMRVFEATGSGAALVADPAPGMEQLFQLGLEVLELDPADPLASVRIDDETRSVAVAGRLRALGVHTYDHRVDELLQILSRVKKHLVPIPPAPPAEVRAVACFAEIDSIACAETDREIWASTSYVVWSHTEILDRQMTVDAVILGNDDVSVADLVALAHRYVICSAGIAPTVRSMLSSDAHHFVETLHDDLAVFDFEVPGYIVRGASWPA